MFLCLHITHGWYLDELHNLKYWGVAVVRGNECFLVKIWCRKWTWSPVSKTQTRAQIWSGQKRKCSVKRSSLEMDGESRHAVKGWTERASLASLSRQSVWLSSSCFVALKALHIRTEQPEGTEHFTVSESTPVGDLLKTRFLIEHTPMYGYTTVTDYNYD